MDGTGEDDLSPGGIATGEAGVTGVCATGASVLMRVGCQMRV